MIRLYGAEGQVIMDNRIEKLSDILINYSCRLKRGERILIDYSETECIPLVKQLIRDAYRVGAEPFASAENMSVRRELLLGAGREQLEFRNEIELARMKGMDAYIAVRASNNISELSDVSPEQMSLFEKAMSPTLRYRVDNTKWCVLRYPTNSMAQQAGMSQEAFEDFFFDVCTFDYGKMSDAMDPLKDLMDRTDRVRILGPGTDLSFSIKGIGSVKCDGSCNIPDGEVYTAPVKDSMNGVIQYNTASLEHGFTYENVRFEVKDGRIVKATANDTARINALLDTDEGARYFGEFSFGLNPYIMEPMKDILFDEKISGSFHLTPGMCYEDAPNGNKSAVHWDLVNIQRPEYGGGEIWFDDVLIRKDGLFVVPELECLNPDKLK